MPPEQYILERLQTQDEGVGAIVLLIAASFCENP